MSNLAQIIKEVDGVEFYTDIATGKSGISQSGLAILCGVDEKSIRNAINSIRTSKPYKGLEHLVDKVSECRTKTKSGMWLCNDELCIAIIRYYDRKGNETAQFTFDKFAAIGFNTWVQSITGWEQSPEPTKPWTPPKLFPNMTENQFKSLSPADQQYLMESEGDRLYRKQQERREINSWLEKCWRKNI